MENIEYYRFADDIYQAVKPYYQLNNWHGCKAWLEDFLIIGSAMALPYVVSWYWYPLSLIVIGSRQRALATLLHESAHRTLAKNKTLNFILGTFGSGYLIFQTMDSYRDSHVRRHHGHFGDFNQDPDYAFMLNQGIYNGEVSQTTFIWHYLLSPLLLLKVPQYLYSLVIHRLFEKQNYRELMRMGLCWIIILLAVGSTHHWLGLLLLWIVPFLTTFQIIGWFIELAEHYPLMDNRVNLRMSRNRHSAWLEYFLTGMHNENLHLVHHLFPTVPFWHLPKVHQILLRDTNYKLHDSGQGGILWSSNGQPSVLKQCVSYCNTLSPNSA